MTTSSTTTDSPSTSADINRRTRSLSKSFVDLIASQRLNPEVFDVIIVGSGYGGSIAAQQLAGLKNSKGKFLKVAMLERGSEYLPGMFPSAFADLPGHVRYGAQAKGMVSGNLEGLLDIRLGDDVNALVANGLGGGSLINAGVMISPDFKSFESDMPDELIADLSTEGGFLDQAKSMLIDQPLNLLFEMPPRNDNTIEQHQDYSPNPQGVFPLKFNRLQELGAAVSNKAWNPTNLNVINRFEAAEISVAMKSVAANKYGINLNACVACGDCMTGCNVGAKSSLNTNLLAQAKRDGIEIYTGASVLSLKRVAEELNDNFGGATNDNIWELEVVHTSLALRKRAPIKQKHGDTSDRGNEKETFPPPIKARHVILAAGTFGSTEILLRSRSAKLAFSSKLGERFSCNGDNIAAIYGLPKAAHCTDDEFKNIRERDVGPTITGTIHVPNKVNAPGSGYLIQEFAVPAPLKRIFEEVITTGKVIANLEKPDCCIHGDELSLEHRDDIDPMAINNEVIENSFLLGIIGHDDAAGVLQLQARTNNADMFKDQEGCLQIVWPKARDGTQLNEAYERLSGYAKDAFPNATILANPIWRLLPYSLETLVTQPRGPVLTVHPLGGCSMGATADSGVVDDIGVVFNAGNQVDDWQGSLLVLDGSIIPGSLGVNPSLTISAVALRAMQAFIAKKAGDLISKPLSEAETSKAILPEGIIFDIAQPKSTRPPIATAINVTERLVGTVCLLNSDGCHENFVLELTLRYERIKLRHLMRTWRGREQKITEFDTTPTGNSKHQKYAEASHLRIFRHEDWDSGLTLRVADDDVREQYALLIASVKGNMTFLHRQTSTYWCRRFRAGLAYFQNRGLRDTWQTMKEKFISHWGLKGAKKDTGPSLFKRICDSGKLSSHAGEVRLFNYALEVDKLQYVQNIRLQKNSKLSAFQKHHLTNLILHLQNNFKGSITGEKELTYNRRANPWQQLTTLMMKTVPLGVSKNAVLRLDGRFIAKQGIPLLEIAQQENHANALLDMASFGLFMGRLLLNMHLWSFRKPDPAPQAEQYVEIDRLPRAVRGLPEPEIAEIPVSFEFGKNRAVVRLTRYRGTCQGATTQLNPIALLHGYSASGNTFTHPTLDVSLVEFLWHNKGQNAFKNLNRDVWVIDLRTSSGMPTAQNAWSYEEVALTDIPSALLHIKNVTGKRVDVMAHCIGAAMLSMAVLTKADDVLTRTVELGVGATLTDAQLGVLEAFNGASAAPDNKGAVMQHPCVNSIALSQKGPFIRYTEANIFRAYMMRSLKAWIPDGYQFRMSKDPKVTEQVIDRLLATLPYSKAEYDRENPLWPTKNTFWVSTRHRMDALYAQDFSACNISDETLKCIDELFGPLNIETLAQTIHFVRFNFITNQRGRSVFVTIQKLRERWASIPTFAFHGAENGLADVNTQDLLEVNFKAANVPFVKKSFPGFGHQDVFIGTNSQVVFKEIQAFFDNPTTYVPS